MRYCLEFEKKRKKLLFDTNQSDEADVTDGKQAQHLSPNLSHL